MSLKTLWTLLLIVYPLIQRWWLHEHACNVITSVDLARYEITSVSDRVNDVLRRENNHADNRRDGSQEDPVVNPSNTDHDTRQKQTQNTDNGNRLVADTSGGQHKQQSDSTLTRTTTETQVPSSSVSSLSEEKHEEKSREIPLSIDSSSSAPSSKVSTYIPQGYISSTVLSEIASRASERGFSKEAINRFQNAFSKPKLLKTDVATGSLVGGYSPSIVLLDAELKKKLFPTHKAAKYLVSLRHCVLQYCRLLGERSSEGNGIPSDTGSDSNDQKSYRGTYDPVIGGVSAKDLWFPGEESYAKSFSENRIVSNTLNYGDKEHQTCSSVQVLDENFEILAQGPFVFDGGRDVGGKQTTSTSYLPSPAEDIRLMIGPKGELQASHVCWNREWSDGSTSESEKNKCKQSFHAEGLRIDHVQSKSDQQQREGPELLAVFSGSPIASEIRARTKETTVEVPGLGSFPRKDRDQKIKNLGLVLEDGDTNAHTERISLLDFGAVSGTRGKESEVSLSVGVHRIPEDFINSSENQDAKTRTLEIPASAKFLPGYLFKGSLHNSANPVRLKNGNFLCFLHEFKEVDRFPWRNYVHYMAEVGEDFILLRISPPFLLPGIEDSGDVTKPEAMQVLWSAWLEGENNNEKLGIAYSINDCQAATVYVGLSEVIHFFDTGKRCVAGGCEGEDGESGGAVSVSNPAITATTEEPYLASGSTSVGSSSSSAEKGSLTISSPVNFEGKPRPPFLWYQPGDPVIEDLQSWHTGMEKRDLSALSGIETDDANSNIRPTIYIHPTTINDMRKFLYPSSLNTGYLDGNVIADLLSTQDLPSGLNLIKKHGPQHRVATFQNTAVSRHGVILNLNTHTEDGLRPSLQNGGCFGDWVLDRQPSDFVLEQMWPRYKNVVSIAVQVGDSNLWHFLANSLSALAILNEQDFQEDTVIHFTARTDFVVQFMELLGFGNGKPGMFGKVKIVYGDIRVDNLIVPEPGRCGLMSGYQAEWLRKILVGAVREVKEVKEGQGEQSGAGELTNDNEVSISNEANVPDALILIRRSKSRIVTNYEKLHQEAQKYAEKHNLELIEHNDDNLRSVKEQLQIFSRAHTIIGPHGAANTLMVVAPNGVRVIEFHARKKWVTKTQLCYLSLGLVKGWKYVGIPYGGLEEMDGEVDMVDVREGLERLSGGGG